MRQSGEQSSSFTTFSILSLSLSSISNHTWELNGTIAQSQYNYLWKFCDTACDVILSHLCVTSQISISWTSQVLVSYCLPSWLKNCYPVFFSLLLAIDFNALSILCLLDLIKNVNKLYFCYSSYFIAI